MRKKIRICVQPKSSNWLTARHAGGAGLLLPQGLEPQDYLALYGRSCGAPGEPCRSAHLPPHREVLVAVPAAGGVRRALGNRSSRQVPRLFLLEATGSRTAP